MSQKVLLDEGGYVDVHARIKDMCKVARNRLGLTNQQISDLICERFELEDFSVNTINNFFSERSKATTIYTTGFICAVLDISIDTVFGIKNELTSDKEIDYIKQLTEASQQLVLNKQHISHLENTLEEKDKRIAKAYEDIEHLRKEVDNNSHKVQPWVFTLTVVLLILALLFITIYLITFDISNPNYGIFRTLLDVSGQSFNSNWL